MIKIQEVKTKKQQKQFIEFPLRLYKDGEEVLSLPAGLGTLVSAAHDAHHIIDGSLFTVFSDSRRTVVCMDGKEAASWTGQERIAGILLKDGVLHTLGCAGNGLIYRRNGEETLQVDDGVPYGGFGFNTYGPGGALYEHDGKVCFTYQVVSNGIPAVYVCLDGEVTKVFSSARYSELIDAKMLDSGPAVLYNEGLVTRLWNGTGDGIMLPYSRYVQWPAAEIGMLDGELAAIGYCLYTGEPSLCFAVGTGEYVHKIKPAPFAVYFKGDEIVPVRPGVDVPSECYFFSRDCACLSPDGVLTLALTPRDPAQSPYVLRGGERTEYPLHGFITGVSYQISD